MRQFGVPLWYFDARSEVMPQVFLDCVRYIYSKCLQTKELFRQGGDSDDVKFLRAEYNSGGVPVLDKITDPHTIAGLLKTWLSELPQPLLTYALYSECMTAMKLSADQQLKSLQNSIAKIPHINQRVLWILTQLLKLVHDQNAVNNMHAGNLSVLFAPKIINPKADINITFKTQPLFNQLAEVLIIQGDSIFSTAVHSTPPDWSFILDPNRPPMLAAPRKPVTGRPLVQDVAGSAPAASSSASGSMRGGSLREAPKSAPRSSVDMPPPPLNVPATAPTPVAAAAAIPPPPGSSFFFHSSSFLFLVFCVVFWPSSSSPRLLLPVVVVVLVPALLPLSSSPASSPLLLSLLPLLL